MYDVIPTESVLPRGKTAAICFTIDDIHPGTSDDPYEAGGDCENGALGHLLWLQRRHPELKVTLFTTADWRQMSPFPTRPVRHLPWLRDFFFNTPVHPVGTMRLDRHPRFVHFLGGMKNVEIAFHGLHHVHKGLRVGVEFQDEPVPVHLAKLEAMEAIFRASGLEYVRGIAPPTWNATPTFLGALEQFGIDFLASSRDLFTPISSEARCRMSGLEGTSLIHPCRVGQLLHLSTNFQATCPPERAMEVLEAGGILAIKAHIVKTAFGHVSLDALDGVYCNYLDLLFDRIKERFGDQIWWTSMNEVSEHCRGQD